MNKKHYSKVGKYISMACLFFVCAMVQSCRDEYFFDDTAPDFVGPSIYDYLDGQGNFTCFLRVINDLGYKDVLQRTGSKTLFVADDNAFMSGIDKEWGVKEYEQLTAAQKRLILYGAMLDNAYLLEMLSKMQSTGANAEPIPGQCLRRVTSASVTDTIGLFSFKDLPKNNDEWKGEEFNSVRLALDASQTMMTHFIEDQLYMKNINERDLRLLVNNPTARLSDIYIYDKKVIRENSDVTCKNGYVHQLEGLLIPPSNMAEEIRKNGNDVVAVREDGTFDLTGLDATTTQIFSRLLDRFAVPVPIAEGSEVAQNYSRMYGITDKLFEKKYYTESFSSYQHNGLHTALGTLLFDPGWNEYRAGSTDKEQDMAAIFAPSDEAFVEYFTSEKASGKSLLDRYAKGITNLVEAIDSIPVDIIQPLVRNHMQMSFSSTVPSKFEYIVDDARDPMKVLEKDVKKVMLANNGVIYVMDTVYSPARYNSVIAPVMLIDTLGAFNKAIKDLKYDIYLLSMGNKFGLIVTSDSGLVYYDPYTERKSIARDYIEKNLLGYKFDAVIEGDKLVMTAKKVAYDRNQYDANTNSFAELTKPAPVSISADDVNSYFQEIFKEILEYNIVLGDMNSDKDCEGGRQYYMSKGYGAIKVERGDDGCVSAIAGGRELQNGTSVTVKETHNMKNGQTFQVDGSIIQPPTQTVHDVLGHEKFQNFRNLCTPSAKVLKYLFGEETSSNKDKWNKYRIFAGHQGDEQYYLVRFFDTYHYTVYVPCNDAMTTAHEEGLPTWADLEKEIDDFEKAYKPSEDSDGSVKEDFVKSLTAGADLIVKFVRYHFQDNSVFVDKVPHALEVDEGNGNRRKEYKVNYETSAFNEVRNKFCSVLVQSDAEPEDYDPMVNTIAVRGDFGEEDEKPLDQCVNVCRVIKEDENTLYNVMAREVQYRTLKGDNKISKTSSYAVVHQIDDFLVYGGEGGIYDAEKNQFIR